MVRLPASAAKESFRRIVAAADLQVLHSPMEAISDACPPVAAKSSRPHLFSTANAKEMSARGNIAKALAKQKREKLIAKVNGIAFLQPDEI